MGEGSSGGEYEEKLSNIGLKFQDVPVNQKSKNPLSIFLLFFSYVKLLRRERPNVFHAFTMKPMVVGLIAAAVLRVPVRVATVAGLGHIFLSSTNFVQKIAIIVLRFSLRRAHIVIFYNRDDLHYFHEMNLVKPEQEKLIFGSGVDLNLFEVVQNNRLEIKEFIVLYVGRFLKEKGLIDLFDAARVLKENYSKIRIEILGSIDVNNPSSLNNEEIHRAVSEGLVVHHDATSDVRPYIARADAIILPSYREGIPLSLIEGAAMGKPLIATDVPGCREVVRHGETGYLVPPRDAGALAEAIAALASDLPRAEAMGRAARTDVEQRFSASVVTESVITEYEHLLGSHPQAVLSRRQA